MRSVAHEVSLAEAGFQSRRILNNAAKHCLTMDKVTSERCRILMLIPHLGVGGAQGAFLRLAEFLAREADVTIAVMQGDGKAEVPPEIPILSLADLHVKRGKIGRWWFMWQRVRALKREHDVAISFLSGVNLLNALAGPRYKTIVSERGSKRQDISMTTVQRALWTRCLDPLTYWGAAKIVAASDGLTHEIVTANRWAAERVLAIEGTVKAALLVEAADLEVEPEIAVLTEFETVVAFGRLHVHKGYDFLLRAFAAVRAMRPRARLLLIGDGPEAVRLREIATEVGLHCAEPGVDADVIFAGARSQPMRYASVGRVFVLPSRLEGLPNALIEALAAGIPVLAADCRWGPRSILSEGQLGYHGNAPALPAQLRHGELMPVPDAPGALQCWITALDRILSGPRTRTIRDERLRITARYDIATTGPIWLRLVQDLTRIGRQRQS